MSEKYPHPGLGDLIVLGPEVITNGEVISWKGENYVKSPASLPHKEEARVVTCPDCERKGTLANPPDCPESCRPTPSDQTARDRIEKLTRYDCETEQRGSGYMSYDVGTMEDYADGEWLRYEDVIAALDDPTSTSPTEAQEGQQGG